MAPPARCTCSEKVVDLRCAACNYTQLAYRGEGLTALVLCATCDRPPYRIVWRFPKIAASMSSNAQAVSSIERCLRFVAYRIRPAFPPGTVPAAKLVQFGESDMATLHTRVPGARALFSVGVEMADSMVPQPHLELGPGASAQLGPTVAVELKPKQGFINDTLTPALRHCQNCAMQAHKAYGPSPKYATIYDYCPLKLYSADRNRMKEALYDLIREPHANLQIFRDGAVVFSHSAPADEQQLNARLPFITVDELVDAVIFTLEQTGILRQLRNVQKRWDRVGLLAANDCYAAFDAAKRDQFDQLLDSAEFANGGELSTTNDEYRCLLDYVAACTLHDCAVVVALTQTQTHAHGNHTCGVRATHVTKSGVRLQCAATLIDVDVKHPRKLAANAARYVDGMRLLRYCDRKPCIP